MYLFLCQHFDVNSILLFKRLFWLAHTIMYFCQTKVQSNAISNLLKACKINKAAGIDNLSGRSLKDGADVFAIPITQICNLSIKPSHFPKDCKLTTLKPLYKKGIKKDPKHFRPSSLLPIVSKILR